MKATRVPWTSRLVVNGLMALMALYFLFPVWWLIVSSTKSNPDLFATSGFWFAEMNFAENVSKVFTYDSGLFPRWLANSIWYSTTAAVLGTLISTATGYVIAKFEFFGRGALFAGVIGGLLIPGALLTIPLYLVMSQVGLANTPASIIIPSMVTPFGVYLARVYCDASVPDEILEAARLDGAGEIRIFFTVVLRILSPAMVTIGLFAFVGSWNNFFLPLVMLTDRELYPVVLGLYNWQSYLGTATYDIVLTGSLITVVPLAIAFFALQRFWRAGLTLGSIK